MRCIWHGFKVMMALLAVAVMGLMFLIVAAICFVISGHIIGLKDLFVMNIMRDIFGG